MATPSPLRAILLFLLALPFLSFLALHRHPAPLPPPLRAHAHTLPAAAEVTNLNSHSPSSTATSSSSPSPPPPPTPKASASDDDEPTSLRHVVLGVASSRRTLPLRLPLLHLWLRAPARAFLFLDAALPTTRGGPHLPPGLRLRVSADASRFPYSHPRGLPSAVRDDAGPPPPPRWLVLADDDTAFVLPNLLRALGKYDWREPWYLGARSESAAQNAWHGFAMAYGGSGIAVSWPLARRLARALDSCVVRYPHLYGSDARIRACVAELGVELTHEPGFHQVFKGNVLLPDLLAVQKTFVPWKRGRNVTDVYMFDTKHYPRDECKRGALFFLKSISSSEGKTETTYNRQPSRKCSPDLIPLRNVNLIKVTSEQLHLVPGKAFRRQCCDIVRSSSDNIMDVNIRKCKDES
ncbi:hypothetical protein PR202_gb28864 [Eleusine coracana subsp. coracana]|uniref:Uncharacterized protein n=1 Tax=Eleusine coracana subsp. coracana TaxID=191504 RepID=A0AAV5FY53_ELECO|nr:hypothetical protein PR202_gb28864 [Eleusine coracana subsp. coracana]